MAAGGGSGLRARRGDLALAWQRRIRQPPQQGCAAGARGAAKEGPHGLGTAPRAGLARCCWPGDRIQQLGTVFILGVGSKQYL